MCWFLFLLLVFLGKEALEFELQKIMSILSQQNDEIGKYVCRHIDILTRIIVVFGKFRTD